MAIFFQTFVLNWSEILTQKCFRILNLHFNIFYKRKIILRRKVNIIKRNFIINKLKNSRFRKLRINKF